jgi:hypothetical protein
MSDFDQRDRSGDSLHHEGGDPLDALRQAWAEQPTPDPVRELEDEDDVTQKAVQWMADGWKQIPLPQRSLQSIGARETASPKRRASRTPWIPSLALAAAALLLSLATWRFMQPQTTDDPLTERTANAEGEENAEGAGPGSADPNPAPNATQANLPSMQLIANDEEKVQILAGKVRLTMLKGAADPSANQTEKTDY